MKKLILTSIATAVFAFNQTSSAQSFGFSLGNGASFAYSQNGGVGFGGGGWGGGWSGGWRGGGGWGWGGGGYYNNCGPRYIAPQYYVAPYGATWQQRCATPGPIIVPSYAPSFKNNQILIEPFK